MFGRAARILVAAAACAATTSITTVSQALPPTELLGDSGVFIPLKDAAMIVKTKVGYRYIAGQQDSHLTVTAVGGKVHYADTGTKQLRSFPRSCRRESVPKGIGAVCSIPKRFREGEKMFLEVWPRLGDDYVDGSTLTDGFRLWVLADAGYDTVLGGAGDDFVNGAQDADKAWGGAGNDWIRTGIGNDQIWGGDGDDQLVGGDGRDTTYGGEGNDRVGGGSGNDTLYAEAGEDVVACGTGTDAAHVDDVDKAWECESVSRS